MRQNFGLTLQRIFFLWFICFFGIVALFTAGWLIYSYVAGEPYFLFPGICGKPLNPLIIAAGAALLTGLLAALVHAFGKLEDRIHRWLAIALFALLILAQAVFSSIYRVEPAVWDFAMVHFQAASMAVGGNDYSYYFEDYTNNIGVTLLLACLYKAVLWASKGAADLETAGIIFNIAMIDLGVLFVYKTAKRLFGLRQATAALLLAVLFSPFITYAPIYYTDTIVLPFAAGMLYFYFAGRGQPAGKQTLFVLAASLFGTIGTLIKPTVVILFIALWIHLLLTEKGPAFLRQALLAGAILLAGQQAFPAIADASRILPQPYKESGFPYTHWIMMGLKEPYGFYDMEDVLYTKSFPDKPSRKAANLAVIRERLRTYGAERLARLLSAKAVFVWGDGTYFAPVKLNRGVPEYTKWHAYVLPMDGNNNTVYIYYCQSFQAALLFFFLISGFRHIRSKKISPITLCAVAVFGLGLFELIWEARSRYLIHFAPAILLIYADGLLQWQFAGKRRLPKFNPIPPAIGKPG
jgi:Gpi18-like mannosyltransferase